MSKPNPEIVVTDDAILLRWAHGIEFGSLLAELDEVAVRTAAPGEDVDGWLILRDRGQATIPIWLGSDEPPLREFLSRLPGFDWARVDEVLMASPNVEIVLWRR